MEIDRSFMIKMIKFILLTMIAILVVIIMPNIIMGRVNICQGTQGYNYRYLDSNSKRFLSNLKDLKQNVVHSDTIKRKRLPQAIVIGVMKCGTLALKAMMDMHSQFVSAEKEVNFFTEYYDRGLDWYRKKMPLSYSDQVTLEKSPQYFLTKALTPEVPLRIHYMNSSIRLILLVRDPVTRSISHYTHQKEHGRYQSSFRDLALSSDGQQVNYAHPIISNSLYALPLKVYLEVFPPEQILVLDGDQLINDPLPIIKKVERYLNLKPEITEDNIYFDQVKGFYCMQKNGKKECLHEGKGRGHPEIDEDVLRKLRAFFAPHNQRFYDLVGQNFDWPTS